MDLASLPVRTTPDREYLGAICELLLEQLGVLERLANRVSAIEEAILSAPVVGVCVAPDRSDGPGVEPPHADALECGQAPAQCSDENPGPDQEPGPVTVEEPDLRRPPTSGPGSGRSAWATYASSHGIHVDVVWQKQRIIQACRDAGIA